MLKAARRAAAIVLPVLLVLLGLAARTVAGVALGGFIRYKTPFAFPPLEVPTGAPVARQVVVVLIDGLALAPSRGLPFLDELRGRGANYDCVVGEPSLSLPGRAVMLSGAWQEVHGQTTNYNPRPLPVGHVFSVARQHGLLTALAAGRNGLTLFAPGVARTIVFPKDPETAPFATYEAALREQAAQGRGLLQEVRGQRGLVMVELNAVDEAGHGWGGASEEYRRAAAEADQAVRDQAAVLDLDHDAIVVTADHGHVAAGGHGGPEDAVMHVPLVMAGAGIRTGVRGTCRQIDLAPTLSTLLGLPLPASNQGRPLLDALVLDGPRRLEVLRAVLDERERFVAGYVHQLSTLDEPADSDLHRIVPDPKAAEVPPDASEAWYVARLDALDHTADQAKQARRMLESESRSRRALVLAFAPPFVLLLLVLLGVVGGSELRRAAVTAALGLVFYYAALPLAGLRYSLTAVNKDEWLQAYFAKDMAVGLASCAAAVLAGAWYERRRHGARLFDLARFAWVATAVFCYAFVVKIAGVFWTQGIYPRWEIPDLHWGFAFYLDLLVVTAVGLASPLMALPAWVAALGRPRPAAPVATRQVV